MTWNYRVIRKEIKKQLNEEEITEVSFAIHEVYYDGDGNPESVTQDAVAPQAETLVELIQEMNYYRQAFSLPVIEYSFFEKDKK